MKALVIGANSFIGSRLIGVLEARGWDVESTTRDTCDLLNLPDKLPKSDAVFICAAMTRFIECEDDRRAYRANVDAPTQIAELCLGAKIIFCSSEAVERATHTNYGLYKALAELSLRSVCRPHIARISKVIPERVISCCNFLIDLADQPPGVYHWR